MYYHYYCHLYYHYYYYTINHHKLRHCVRSCHSAQISYTQINIVGMQLSARACYGTMHLRNLSSQRSCGLQMYPPLPGWVITKAIGGCDTLCLLWPSTASRKKVCISFNRNCLDFMHQQRVWLKHLNSIISRECPLTFGHAACMCMDGPQWGFEYS